MQGKIWNFAEKYGFSTKYAGRLQLCCEEIIFEMLNNCYAQDDKTEMEVEIIYSEVEKISELHLICGGKNYNPFEVERDFEDDLGVTILKNVAKNFVHSYEDNKNKIKFQLKI